MHNHPHQQQKRGVLLLLVVLGINIFVKNVQGAEQIAPIRSRVDGFRDPPVKYPNPFRQQRLFRLSLPPKIGATITTTTTTTTEVTDYTKDLCKNKSLIKNVHLRGGGASRRGNKPRATTKRTLFDAEEEEDEDDKEDKDDSSETSKSAWKQNLWNTYRTIQQTIPGIQLQMFQPKTQVKISKTFRPLNTIVKIGAIFNIQSGIWQFQSSWEDHIIGGTLSLHGKELELSKTWRVSVEGDSIGAKEDIVAAIRFRAAVDLDTLKSYARLGFRTERLTPINLRQGFALVQQIPLDGDMDHIKMEVKANLSLPEPELEFSTDRQKQKHAAKLGFGDVRVRLDELNLVLDY